MATVNDTSEKNNRRPKECVLKHRASAEKPKSTAGIVLSLCLVVGLTLKPVSTEKQEPEKILQAEDVIATRLIIYTDCMKYDNPSTKCADYIKKHPLDKCKCIRTFKLEKDLTGLVYFGYQLTGFNITNFQTQPAPDCKVVKQGKTQNPAVPCGTLTNYNFTDLFSIYLEGVDVPIQKTDNATEEYWKYFNNASGDLGNLNGTEGTFLKPYGKTNQQTLLKGVYELHVEYNYPLTLVTKKEFVIKVVKKPVVVPKPTNKPTTAKSSSENNSTVTAVQSSATKSGSAGTGAAPNNITTQSTLCLLLGLSFILLLRNIM